MMGHVHTRHPKLQLQSHNPHALDCSTDMGAARRIGIPAKKRNGARKRVSTSSEVLNFGGNVVLYK